MLNLLTRTLQVGYGYTPYGLLGMLNLLSRTPRFKNAPIPRGLLGMLNLLSRTLEKYNNAYDDTFARYVKFIKQNTDEGNVTPKLCLLGMLNLLSRTPNTLYFGISVGLLGMLNLLSRTLTPKMDASFIVCQVC